MAVRLTCRLRVTATFATNWSEDLVQLQRSGENFQLYVSKDELRAFHAGLAETLEALQDWEFETRTGFTRDEFRTVLHDLREGRQSLDRREANDR